MSSLMESSDVLELLRSVDDRLTNFLYFYARPPKPWHKAVELGCKCLEVSGHGLLWFAVSGGLLCMYCLTKDDVYWNHAFNLFVILVIDILLVAPLKLYFKRPRPSVNVGDIPLSVSSVDNYAFPSGHASRSVALAVYFCYMPPFHLRTHLWYVWAMVMSTSRVLLGRHHVSDIIAGSVAGLLIFEIVRRTFLISTTD